MPDPPSPPPDEAGARPGARVAPALLGLRLAHRVLLRDADRLTDLAERTAAGAVPLDPARTAAVSGYLRDWADGVRAHQAAEDELLLPLLAAAAGGHVDVSELHGDHAALGRLLDRLDRVRRAFAVRPEEDTATALAVELADLRSALEEHVREEAAVVLPLAQRHLGVRDRQALERRLARRAGLSFTAPQVPAVVTPDERAVLGGQAGWRLRLATALLGPAHRRRERAVFGRG